LKVRAPRTGGQKGSDWQLGFTNYGPLYFTPEQQVNRTGLLPNDRTHVLKAFGAHQLPFGLNVGASLLVASDTPLSDYGRISISPPFRGLASQRGSAAARGAPRPSGILASGPRTTCQYAVGAIYELG